MNDEKFEKTIEFILNNQAQFTSDIQKLQESQKEAEKRVNVLERACLNLYNTSVEHGKQISENGKQIAQLTEDVKGLREAQRATDERLNAVIYMAEKFFGNQNGKSEK
jgi:septal ring factor EnvC (AmiA/AmiB activator)